MSPTARLRQGKAEKGGSEKGPGKDWKSSKASTKHSSVATGVPTSAYNPGTGMFHMLDSSITETAASNHSGRFRSIDDTDDIGSVIGSYSEYDSVSNNGSCSGESEDQLQNGTGKDRKAQPPGLVGGGSDKRDKIRYKNEKKHQRQKERRAQELRDRCTGYIMSRKLEALAQQLVAMGFSPDRATMALILNEGHVERSVAWLLEGGEGQIKEDWNADGSLKINISEELAKIADLEIRFKYPRVDIERAVVACEGDLEKAAEWLRERHPQDTLVAPEFAASNVKLQGKEQPPNTIAPSYLMTAKGRGGTLFHALNSRDDKEFHPGHKPPLGYQTIQTRPVSTMDGSYLARAGPVSGMEWHRGSSFSVDGGKAINNVMRNPPQNAPLSYAPSGRHPLDPRAPAHENLAASRREQGFSMNARDAAVTPQSPITPPLSVPSASVSPSMSPSSWHGSVPGASSPSSVLYFNRPGDGVFKGAVGAKTTGNTLAKQAEERMQPLQLSRPDMQASAWGGGSSGGTNFGGLENGLSSVSLPASSSSHIRTQPAPKFLSGWGSGLSGGSDDWSMWVSNGCDYNNIDWSMGLCSSNSADDTVWSTASSFASVLSLGDSSKQGLGLGSEGGIFSQVDYTGNRNEGSGSSANFNLWNSSSSSRGHSIPALGLQEKPVNESGSSSNMGVVPEWTSPFAGKDLFTLPHQPVPSPLL